MQIAIVEDQAESREDIKKNLQCFFDRNYTGTHLQIREFSSGEDFLQSFSPEMFDLIFLDYYLGGISGLETAVKLRKRDAAVPLIFITTSRDFAVESYQVRASGYLVKPYSYASFEQTLRLSQVQKILDGRYIEVLGEKILLKYIVFCDLEGHYTQIHTTGGYMLRFRMAFSQLAERLAPYDWFFSCYRGCIVNLKRVQKLNELDILMDDGNTVFFRKKDLPEIQNRYAQFLFNRAREENNG